MNSRKKYNNQINISGSKIKNIREDRKISRENLSRNLLIELGIDISAQSIANLENNLRTIVDYELWGIAKILKVDIKDLIGE